MVTCSSGKKVYFTQELAEEALIGARTRFEYREGNGPVGVYKCEDCGNYHLTSRGPMNHKLKQNLDSGVIDRQKQADSWLSKLKNKKGN